MSLIIADSVLETSTTTGTGNLTLAGAVTGFSTFASRCANGDTFQYYVEAVDANGNPTGPWETGHGSYVSATPAISRTAVYLSSNSDALVNFAAGTKRIAISLIADTVKSPYIPVISPPATPVAGSLRLYAVSDDGVVRYEYITPDGETLRVMRDHVLTVRNNSGVTLTKGYWVYLSGAVSTRDTVALARADSQTTAPAIGVMLDTVTNGNDGRCMIGGLIFSLNTASFTDGDTLYLSDSSAGIAVNTAPATGFKQRVGFCISAHASNGIILVAPARLSLRFDDVGNLLLPAVPNPATPPADTLAFYARRVSGRMVPKWLGPSGVDTPFQPALFGNRIVTFNPSNGVVGTGSGCGFGNAWTVGTGVTISHNGPSTTSPAITYQTKATMYANVITTTNQECGIRYAAASEQQFWRGNATGLGGFFYFARFFVDVWATSCRIFAGVTGNTSTGVAISDTVINDTCGLWHDSGDPASGAGAFNFVTRDNTTTTKQQITLSNAIAAGNSYDFYMFCKPNDSTLYWRLDDIVNNVTYEGNTGTTLPRNTIFLQPQCAGSNAANTAATTIRFAIAGMYIESDH